MIFGNKKFNKRPVLTGFIILKLTLVLVAILLGRALSINYAPVTDAVAKPVEQAIAFQGESVENRIRQLKELKLWDIEPEAEIPSVVFTGYPENIHEQTHIPTKKKVFLHTLLPVALVVLREVEQERTHLLEIIEKTGLRADELIFSGNHSNQHLNWLIFLNDEEIAFIRSLTEKYRTRRADRLLTRVDVFPVSLILAQGAIESSWGGSRFAREGNNLFGVWTWGEQGIIPAAREAGKRHKIMIYDSILGSVRSYVLNLNRLGAYEQLRMIRQRTYDSRELANGLLYYSEKRGEYVADLKRIINSNRLFLYDSNTLSMNNRRQDAAKSLVKADIVRNRTNNALL